VDKARARLDWRWAVVAVEVVVAAACLFAGWRLVHHNSGGPAQVERAGPPAAEATDQFRGIPIAPSSPAARPGHGSGPGAVGLAPGADLLNRLNRDDLAMYRNQWRVIQVLADGARQYIERRVVPALSPAA
jgi:hypothetical protein